MPNLEIDRFVTPEQNFNGLYKAADQLRENRLRSERLRNQEQARMLGTSNFLSNYLDKKDFLTGTNYDPQIVSQLGELMQQGAELASKGADTPTIMMALGPKVNRLSEYSQKAKYLNTRLKEQMQLIPQNAGYNKQALENEAKRLAFFDDKGQLKDITTVDPDTDWISETVKRYPERVTTDAGIDEFVKSSPKFFDTRDITAYTPTGGMNRKKVKITSPAWMTPDIDMRGATTGLVPRYQTALEGGQPLLHDFVDDAGKTVKAPVRLLDERLFDSMMSQNPGIADWVRGQVNRHLSEYKTDDGKQIDINSAQAKNVARAIMYDELKRRQAGGMEDVEIQNKPSTQEIKLNLGLGGKGGASGGDININDVYQGIRDDVKEARRNGVSYLTGNKLKSDATDIVLKSAHDKGYKDLTQDDIKVGVDDNDNIEVFYSNKYLAENKDITDPLITKLKPADVNLKAKQPGIKEKRKIIQEGSATTSGSDTYTYQGITGTYDQLVEVVGKAEADKLIKTGKAKKK